MHCISRLYAKDARFGDCLVEPLRRWRRDWTAIASPLSSTQSKCLQIALRILKAIELSIMTLSYTFNAIIGMLIKTCFRHPLEAEPLPPLFRNNENEQGLSYLFNNTIPNELVVKILQYCDGPELMLFSRTCQTARRCVNELLMNGSPSGTQDEGYAEVCCLPAADLIWGLDGFNPTGMFSAKNLQLALFRHWGPQEKASVESIGTQYRLHLYWDEKLKKLDERFRYVARVMPGSYVAFNAIPVAYGIYSALENTVSETLPSLVRGIDEMGLFFLKLRIMVNITPPGNQSDTELVLTLAQPAKTIGLPLRTAVHGLPYVLTTEQVVKTIIGLLDKRTISLDIDCKGGKISIAPICPEAEELRAE
ncbi:MAG: hypothetical protein HW387_652 [Parachlamydiales bacterium]|nr:hypothetical protein [Parachlamydiales bacterium]